MKVRVLPALVTSETISIVILSIPGQQKCGALGEIWVPQGQTQSES